jgi:hypothetical protein
MGGKSRKSGGVSKALIQRIVSNQKRIDKKRRDALKRNNLYTLFFEDKPKSSP